MSMFLHFLFLEIRSGLKRPMVYIFILIFTILTFAATSSESISIGGGVGNVLENAPFVLYFYVILLGIFALLTSVAFFNNAALRDFKYNFDQILFSTPLSRAAYYFGRFFGALFLASLPLLGVFIGSWLASILAPLFNWVDADRFGTYDIQVLIRSYLLIILPSTFFIGAIIYLLATKWRSTIVSFVGVMLILTFYLASTSLLSDLDNENLAAYIDPFGLAAFQVQTQYLSPAEKNVYELTFTGMISKNRMVWSFVGAIILALGYLMFSFKTRARSKKTKVKIESTERSQSFAKPALSKPFVGSVGYLQFRSFFKSQLYSIIRSATFKIILIFSIILTVSNLWNGYEYFGLKSYPLDYKINETIAGSILFVLIVMVFFSGELVWRDRDQKISEVIDSTAHSKLWKAIALTLALILGASVIYFISLLAGITYQIFQGYYAIDLKYYLLSFWFEIFPVIVSYSGLLVLIQVIVRNKYIGYFISVLVFFCWDLMLLAMNVNSNLISIGGSPSLFYSEMNGFGPGLQSAIWFNFYWILFGVICVLLAAAFWQRGVMRSFWNRLKSFNQNLSQTHRRSIVICSLLFLGLGAWIYYNTQHLNDTITNKEYELASRDYELKYKKYQDMALPKIKAIDYAIDLFPNKRAFNINATMELKNETKEMIDSICFTYDSDFDTEINIGKSDLIVNDEEIGFRIYKLARPLAPGENVTMVINLSHTAKGFRNDRGRTDIVKNGTFINSSTVMPHLGYLEEYELSDKIKRKKYKLPWKMRMPRLEKDCNDACQHNYLTNGEADFINVRTVISTSADQIAIAPGELTRNWDESDRRYFEYVVQQPSQYFYSFVSARYEVAKRNWNDSVSLEVYYDKKHHKNVDRMLDAMANSLDYYTTHFGPYEHSVCRIIEFPRYATFAQAFPGTMPYSESFGFVVDLEDEEGYNIIDAVIAHEIAHQWWAHQVIGAHMQGSTMFSESFAEYSSLMVMKAQTFSPKMMSEFMKYNHNRYLRGRSSEREGELPLYKVENQQYIHYGKGSVVLYALQEMIGEDSLNLAMRSFLETYRYQGPPYPTSLDFLAHLEPRVPDSLHYLIDDWIKTITLYDMRVDEASYTSISGDSVEVQLKLQAHKFKADSLGVETAVAINDWVDIGFFMDKNEEEFEHIHRVQINEVNSDLTIDLPQKPHKVILDPQRLLIDRVYSDNEKVVSETSP